MPDELRVTRGVGVNYRHEAEFEINRPYGSGDYLLLHFLTPMMVHDVSGTKCAAAGTCIVYAPGFGQWYRGLDKSGNHAPMGNDWVHFSGVQVKNVLAVLNIPVNKVFIPFNTEYLAPILSDIQREIMDKPAHWQRMISLRLHDLFLNLSRNLIQLADAQFAAAESHRLQVFRKIRSCIHKDLGQKRTVAEIARMAHLSPSRFAHLYTSYFQTTPIEDLITARLQKATWLLTNTTLHMGAVANLSGFENIYYFSRLFHRRIGCAPRDYYQEFVAKHSEP